MILNINTRSFLGIIQHQISNLINHLNNTLKKLSFINLLLKLYMYAIKKC